MWNGAVIHKGANAARAHSMSAHSIGFCFYWLLAWLLQCSGNSAHNQYWNDDLMITATTSAAVPISQVYALKMIYDSLNGEDWSWRLEGNRWNFTSNDLALINPCNDSWQGISCCNCTISICNICEIDLSAYNLYGELTDLTNLTMLNYFDFSNNIFLSGNLWSLNTLYTLNQFDLSNTSIYGDLIPIQNLTELNKIELSSTFISGDLSPLKSLAKLNTIDLFDALIIGDLWPISTLSAMSYINLNNTNIYGDLAPIQNLTVLKTLYMDYTLISGDLWPISSLNGLRYIELDNTYISGDLWPLSNLSNLITVAIDSTDIFGDLTPFQNLTALNTLGLFNTSISGDLWPLIFLSGLKYIYLYNSDITGDLTPIQNLTTLSIIDLSGTLISGDLWPLASLTNLNTIVLSSTAITGDLRPIQKLSNLTYIDFSNTRLSGDLNPIQNLTKLNTVFLHNIGIVSNLLPLRALSALQYCLLNDNLLFGPVPFLNNTSLEFFNVANNLLTGNLDENMFPNTLVVLEMSENMLSGILPMSLLALPNLQVFDASINCMTLEFNNEICKSTSLQYLILDGLHSATACRQILPIRIVDTIYRANLNVISNIPSCLYSLGQLEYLHMSGNGITGTLPADAMLSSTFAELVVANNAMQSIIPASFQNHKWSVLDLSYNMFIGGLTSNLSISDSVSLQINRLSGDIPTSLYDTTNVNILNGNMFACTSEQLASLDDKVGNKYICGSSSFNVAAILCFAVIMLGVIILSLTYTNCDQWHYIPTFVSDGINMLKRKKKLVIAIMETKNIVNFIDNETNSVKHRVDQITIFMHNVRRTGMVFTAVIVIVYMLLYAVLSMYYGTYTHQYAWTASIAFLSGQNIGIVLYVIFLTQLIVICYLYRLKIADVIVSKPSRAQNDSGKFWRYLIYLAVFVANLCIVLVLNGVYIYVVLNYGETYVVIVEIVFGMFKVVWTNYVLFLLVQQAEIKFLNTKTGAYAHLNLLSLLSVLNNIILPCLASALVNPECFYNLIYSADDVSSNFSKTSSYSTYNQANFYFEVVITTSSLSNFTPSFSYSYECSSATLTSYSTIFLYSALFSALLPPIIDYFSIKINKNIRDTYIGTTYSISLNLLYLHITVTHSLFVRYINHSSVFYEKCPRRYCHR